MMARMNAAAAMCINMIFFCFLGASMGATAVPAKKASFYDALVADSANHRMILSAISNDAATKAMLKLPLNVTAFVPTDKAFQKAAVQFKLGNDTSKLMANTCLIKALLNYHIITPAMTTDKLKKLANSSMPTKKTMLLVTSASNPLSKVAQPLTFTTKGTTLRINGGGSSGQPVDPKNVIAGRGIMTNIDSVLLPTTDLAKLAKMTGCKITL